MNFTKYFGIILLISGLLLIGWGIWSSYQIFSAKVPPPEVFKPPVAKVSPALQKDKSLNPQELQKEMEKMLGEQLKNILPLDSLPRVLNLTSWSIFMWILVAAGGKIASLGIQMMKK